MVSWKSYGADGPRGAPAVGGRLRARILARWRAQERGTHRRARARRGAAQRAGAGAPAVRQPESLAGGIGGAGAGAPLREASLGAARRYWIIDETSFPKAGGHSAGVARQYCGALGKLANCQVAVSLHAAETSLARRQPLGWKLFLPPEWHGPAAEKRRRAAGIPPPVGARTKPELALDLLDLARERGGAPGTVLADEVYGGSFAWRAALRHRGLAYVVAPGDGSRVWSADPLFLRCAPPGGRAGGSRAGRAWSETRPCAWMRWPKACRPTRGGR